VCTQLLTPLRRSLDALDPRTAASVAPAAAAAAVQGLLTRVRTEGKGGVRAGRGGAARLAADIEALIAAADIDSLKNAGADASAGSKKSTAVSDWTDEATSGAGATASSAWRSVVRRARAVASLAAAAGGGGDLEGAAAGAGLVDAEEWRRVCLA